MSGPTLVICAALLGVACGGKVESGGPSGPSSDAAANDGGWDFSSQPLPPCVLGNPASFAASCSYLVDGRCYAKKLDACACACPADHDSVCISDFPSNDAPVQVSCD
jgi:hypothetical protein